MSFSEVQLLPVHPTTSSNLVQQNVGDFCRQLTQKSTPCFSLWPYPRKQEPRIDNSFNDYFCFVFALDTVISPCRPSNISVSNPLCDSLSNISLSPERIFSSLLNLDTKKTSGADNTLNMLLYRHAEKSSSFYLLFTKYLFQVPCCLEMSSPHSHIRL